MIKIKRALYVEFAIDENAGGYVGEFILIDTGMQKRHHQHQGSRCINQKSIRKEDGDEWENGRDDRMETRSP